MITSDTNFRGNFDSIEAVWEAIPYGGVEGDYLNIQGVKYRWNKYLAMWENAEVVTETPARETVTFDEDVNMQNNLTVAGVLRAKKFVVDDLPTGIEEVEITESAVSGGNNVITFTYTNGESQTFIIKNGEAGKTQAAFAVVADALDKTGWDTAKCYLVLTETEGEFDVYSYENEAWNKIDTIEIDLNYNVVQTTGQSTTSVMSQKVVTEAINNLSENLESINNYNYYLEAAGDNYGKSTGAVWEYNGDIYAVVGDRHIWIYKNGVIFYTFTSNLTTFSFGYGVAGHGKYVYWSTFAVASGNVTWTLHSLDIETKARVAYTDTIVKSFSGSANSYSPVISYHAFNDKLYASIGCTMAYQSTVDLYEITDTGFLYVNRIFTANEEWGKRISTDQSIETDNLSYVKLADDGNTLYCEVRVSRGNLPFVKKLVDDAWTPYSIFMADAALALNTDFTITPKGRIFHVQANGTLIWLDVTCNHVFQINITDILSVSKTAIGTVSGCLMFWLTDSLYVLFLTSGGNCFKIVKVKKDYLDNIMDGGYTKEIVTTDASALASLKNGEALMLIGGNNTITQWSSTGGYWPGRAVAPTMYFPKDSIWRIISRGVANRYIYYPISYGTEKFSNIPFRSKAYYNPFYSGGFRIPCIDYYKNKFYAMCSARYFTGGDHEPAEGVLCKSTNDGHEWKEYVKALPIISGEGSAEKRSSMDGVMLIDRYASSPHVNRIWAFCRDDNSNYVGADNTVEYVHFVARYSDDDGLTWSEPIDLTDALLADAPSNVKLFVSGCSAGITLANGTLVLPIYYTTTASGYNPYATFIYSTDHGDTWKLGDIAPVYSDESVIIQKEDGTLVMSSRARHDNNKHLFFSLSSIGSGWQQIQNTNFPSYTCCYGFGYCNGVYVISAPVNSDRQNITVYASKDLSNWKKIVQISSGSSSSTNRLYGYSQLVFNQNTLAVLFENKSKNVEFTNLKEYLPSVFGC